jgi:hypothetical protein
VSAGLVLAGVCAALAAWGGVGVLARRGRAPLHSAVFVLAGFALVFAANATVKRVCLGTDAAAAGRSVPYQIPFVLAMYLMLATRPATATRRVLLPALAVACVAKEFPRMQRANHQTARFIAEGKRAWSACYRASGDLQACQARFQMYPRPEANGLEQKLMYLRSHRLNLFKD